MQQCFCNDHLGCKLRCKGTQCWNCKCRFIKGTVYSFTITKNSTTVINNRCNSASTTIIKELWVTKAIFGFYKIPKYDAEEYLSTGYNAMQRLPMCTMLESRVLLCRVTKTLLHKPLIKKIKTHHYKKLTLQFPRMSMLNVGIGEIHFVDTIYKTVIYNVYNLRNTKCENKKNNSAVDNFFTSTFRKKFTQRVNQIALVHKQIPAASKIFKTFTNTIGHILLRVNNFVLRRGILNIHKNNVDI